MHGARRGETTNLVRPSRHSLFWNDPEGAVVFREERHNESNNVMNVRVLTAAAFSAALALAPAVHAADWHRGGDWHGHYHGGGGGAAVGAAIAGGIIGLGLGAAAASNYGYGYGYAPPPPVYYGYGYGAPGYYAPPPVYYGY